jgi:5-methyltetrahydropteroyltriglutamate--homocysteine methyltransferase
MKTGGTIVWLRRSRRLFGKPAFGTVDYGPWSNYAYQRLSGWEPEGARPNQPPATPLATRLGSMAGRRERVQFAEFYEELSQTLPVTRPRLIFTGPIRYQGMALLRADLGNLRAALDQAGVEEAFMCAVAPGSFGRGLNYYYATDEEYLLALAEAMGEEYRAIVDAGFILQVDDPGLPDSWDMMNPALTLEEYRKYAAMCVEALNHGLRNIPEDRVRYHICWGSWHGPHTADIPLRDIVDILLRVRVWAYSVEAGNVRHEHEWKVWRNVKLPEGKILIPGVVSHATNVVEHAEVVADRILNYASVVGRENVIAGTDCGLGGRIHHQLVWAKLQALAEGARLASSQLWKG